MACRTAGARNQAAFWQLIRDGQDCLERIQDPHWLACFAEWSDRPVPARYGCMHSKTEFDAAFFGIQADEAAAMDLPQRVLLEAAYTALEDAAINPASLKKQAVGVFIGSVGGGAQASQLSAHSLVGTDTSVLASRIAYFLDLKGPALTINTACSSSLVALDIACEYLRNGKIDLALVGGATIYTDPRAFVMMNNAGMLSPTETCRPFDDRADGMVVGDGCGMLVLKRLPSAIRDHDPIYGTIAAIGTNQNGQTAGMTVPSYLSQSQLQLSLYRRNRINAAEMQYIETHGTATKLGDPIEIDALKQTFCQFTDRQQFCALGSLKANVGHTTAASGVLSVIKVLLSMQHQVLPPSLNFAQPNRHIDFVHSPFFVNTTLREWSTPAGQPRLAAVTSLGHSGTNAHLVLAEYRQPPPATLAADSTPVLVPLSAKTAASLTDYAQRLATFLAQQPTLPLRNVAYTLQVSREMFANRCIFLVNSLDELVSELHAFIAQQSTQRAWQGHGPVQTLKHTDTLPPLATLAAQWAAGGPVAWAKLYREPLPQRLHLPTYAFAKHSVAPPPKHLTRSQTRVQPPLMQLLQQVLAAVLQCAVETIAVQANVFALGLNSLGAVRFLTALEQLLGQKLSSSALFEYPSLTQFAAYLQQQFAFVVTQADVAALTNTLTHVLTPPAHPDFPELVALNAVTTGRPVFWFHGGLGGVQPYHVLAQVCTRPFYGIQASGWNSERPPLYGVETMAAYYIQAMQAVQPTGPYEVGGYSLGGLLAYEVTRQLQQHGETVASIVMLDTFEVSGLTAPKQSQKSAYLQAVNIALQTRVMQDPAAFARILIHRDQVDTQLDEAAFLQQLIALAQTRGVFYSADHLATQLVKQAEVQTAHQAHRYSMPPLPQPEAVQCYYVRNRNGVYMGELAPYFMLPGDEFDFEQKAHWQAWQALLPNFTLLEVDAANHLVLLSEPEVCQQLMDFCHNLYSGRLDLTGSEKF